MIGFFYRGVAIDARTVYYVEITVGSIHLICAIGFLLVLSVCWPRNKPTFEVIREAPLGGMTTIN
jgi:hypothetical protein